MSILIVSSVVFVSLTQDTLTNDTYVLIGIVILIACVSLTYNLTKDTSILMGIVSSIASVSQTYGKLTICT